jgi:mono/diheme cytochrome c family protein
MLIIKMGFVPINADAAPSGFENKLIPLAVRAAVERGTRDQTDIRATQPDSAAPTDIRHETDTDLQRNDDLVAGAEIYTAMCAQCHGQTNGRPSVLGASFYPPAPQLPGRGTSYSEAEVFWIVKHGIRNTSMPTWRHLLSDENIRQVTAYVKRMDSLPDNQSSRVAAQGN